MQGFGFKQKNDLCNIIINSKIEKRILARLFVYGYLMPEIHKEK